MRLILRAISIIFTFFFAFGPAAPRPASARELPAFSISGYVSNSKDSSPVEGATISVNGRKAKKKTGRNGYYELKLKPGEYRLSFSKKGYRENGTVLSPADLDPRIPETQRNISLEPIEKSLKIKGRLIDRVSGDGVRAEMRVNDEIVFSSHDGAFECETFPGAARVTVRSAEHRPYDRKFSAEEAEALRAGIEIYLQRYTLFSTAEGVVLEKKSGKPVFEAVVEIDGKRALTDDLGGFSMRLDESGLKKLVCSRDGFKTIEKKVRVKAGRNKVKIYLDIKEKGLIEKLREKYEKEILD